MEIIINFLGAVMELNKLYEVANKENITIINFKMKNKAIIGKVNKKYCIRFELL